MAKLSKLGKTIGTIGLASWLIFVVSPDEFRDKHKKVYQTIGFGLVAAICTVGLSQTRKNAYESLYHKPYEEIR